VAIGLAAARSEKIWAESLNDLHFGDLAITTPSQGQEPFDPARVPASGGMASRLLAGITATHRPPAPPPLSRSGP
jgi:hypothetical protein